jgi:Protein of unknown function (Hypoth_ymh)
MRFYDAARDGSLWRDFPEIIPFRIIDSRLIPLAITFHEDPTARIRAGWTKLEDIFRARTGLKDHGSNLFTNAFYRPLLHWPDLGDPKERVARVKLFEGAYGSYRNPISHRDLSGSVEEFLLLNHLYLLEREAVDVNRETPSPSQRDS